MSTHTGTMINDIHNLTARVDNAVALSALDREWSRIAEIRTRLADVMFENGHPVKNYPQLVRLYCDLANIQECYFSGKIRECRFCHEMEGLHHCRGIYCRDQRDRGIFSSALVSYRFEAK